MVTDDDDDMVNNEISMVNNEISIPYYNGNVDADDDVDYDGDRYDDDDDDDDLCLNYASLQSLCTLSALIFLPSFIVFESAIMDFLNSTVLMRLCQLNGEIVYNYDLTI